MDIFFDVVVIGSGPGGQRAALAANKAGKRVAIVERERELGGACVHQGTIPSKTLRETALTITKLKRSSEVFDFSLRPDLEVATLIEGMHHVVSNYTNEIENELKAQHIEIFKGRARIRDPQLVTVQEVDGRIQYLETHKIIIATGSRPRHPEHIPIDHEHVLDSDSILSMLYLPRSLTVLGAGVIGSEYASIFAILGVKVSLIDEAERPLTFVDPELTEHFLEHFRSSGSDYYGKSRVKDVSWNGKNAVVTTLENGEVIESEKLLVASGRVANTEGLGIEALGINTNARGHIEVDSNFETSIPGIFAVGDVVGYPSLATTSMEQGRRAAGYKPVNSKLKPIEQVPIGIYAVPEIASIGIDEKLAAERFGADAIVVGRADFKQVASGQIMGIKNGILKLVAEKKDYRLLGVQIVGDGATELIHIGEIALVNSNSTKVFLENILNFPTLAEAYRIAALDMIGADG